MSGGVISVGVIGVTIRAVAERTPEFPPHHSGGLGTHLVALATSLAERGWTIDVILPALRSLNARAWPDPVEAPAALSISSISTTGSSPPSRRTFARRSEHLS